MSQRSVGRAKRHRRIRKRVAGVQSRLRLCVFRSHKHLYVQFIDDMREQTVLGMSTTASSLRKSLGNGGTRKAATRLGELVASEAAKRGITQVVFDRGGYQYHGRVKALADGARAGGLKF